MKENEATFFMFLLFKIMKCFNETKKMEGEKLNGIWKERDSRI
jgi:chloramphenicol O-acetyltransferase